MSRADCIRWLAGVLLLPSILAGTASASPLFDGDEVIEIGLSGPFGSLFEAREDRPERAFLLDQEGLQQAVKIRPRGHSRIRVCEFPPLRLNFPAEVAPQSVFAGQDKLKLVTHCRNHDRGEQDLLQEYAAYRILNVLTDISYRVRLLRIHYQDSDGTLSEKSTPRYGFVIESREEFAERTGARQVVLAGFPRHRHELKHAALMYVFQYLIGNTDWQLLRADHDEGCCHNLELFELDSQIIFVPYDFDLAGLVNARYAYPDIKLRIKRVTQRLYRGLCTDRNTLRGALRAVRAKRDEILAVVSEVPGLEQDNVEWSADYLADFFEETENEERLLDTFEKHCVEEY